MRLKPRCEGAGIRFPSPLISCKISAHGRDRRKATPKEQPPRKLSGSGTVQDDNSEERPGASRSTEGASGRYDARESLRSVTEGARRYHCDATQSLSGMMRADPMTPETRTVAVIGGGITGVTTAYALAKRGLDVTLYERHRYAAMETSFANGGQLSASNAETWTHPSTILKGIMWMFRKDAPLLLNLSPSWHKYSWIAEFLASMPKYRANTIATARLAIEARQHLFGWARDEGIDFDVEHRGILHVYRNRKNFDHARRVNALLAEGGLLRDELSPADIDRIEPDVVRLDRGRTGGVKIRTLVDSERYDAVVICAGCASRHFAKQVGDRVNVYPVKGYSITVHLDDGESRAGAPMVSLLDDETKLVSSRLGPDRFRVAGTAEFSGFNRDIRAGRTAPLTQWVETHFPNVSTERVVPWAGLRPMMPDMMPRVGPGHAPGVFYNTGHGHLGWTLSAATAEAIAVAVAGPDAEGLARAA